MDFSQCSRHNAGMTQTHHDPSLPTFVALPLDGRPVCDGFPALLAQACGVNLQLPPSALLGSPMSGANAGLKTPGDCDALLAWCQDQLRDAPDATLLLAADTALFGGLIPGRVNQDSLETLEQRQAQWLAVLQSQPAPVVFSSILRIPHYNGDEEEPAYWATHGEALYWFSEAAHQFGMDSPQAQAIAETVPEAVLVDMLERRGRHFALNQAWLNAMATHRGLSVVFCQDDTGAYGLNVQEAEHLRQAIAASQLTHRAHVQTGADELLCTAMARTLHQQAMSAGSAPLRVAVVCTTLEGLDVMARYDGQSIGAVIAQQCEFLGLTLVQTLTPGKDDTHVALDDLDPTVDLVLVCHTPATEQGDHMMGHSLDETALTPARERLVRTLHALQQRGKALVLVDTTHANGADPNLVECLMVSGLAWENLAGFAAWNTTGNRTGSVLAMAVMKTLAQRRGLLDTTVFSQVLLTRFLDDWAYQSIVRPQFQKRGECPTDENALGSLKERFRVPLAQLQQWLMVTSPPQQFDVFRALLADAQFAWPCKRLFEVAVTIPARQKAGLV